jgi:hypothetical protein
MDAEHVLEMLRALILVNRVSFMTWQVIQNAQWPVNSIALVQVVDTANPNAAEPTMIPAIRHRSRAQCTARVTTGWRDGDGAAMSDMS